MKRQIILYLPLAFVLAFSPILTVAQEKSRVIRESLQGESPISIVGVRAGTKTFDRTIENRHAIRADDTWLYNLTLDVKNVSSKNITYLELYLRVPKTGNRVKDLIFSMVFGDASAPGVNVAPNSDGVKPDVMIPGSVRTIKIRDGDLANFESLFKSGIGLVETTIREVHFDDRTGWQLGIELRQDPNVPTKWISV